MTYRFGLDPQSLGVTIAWVMECAERGILTPQDLDGRNVSFGDGQALVDLTEAIARRRGVGDLLAEGSMRAAARIGRGSERYAMTSKGKELPIHEPRNKPGLALAWATGPIGPDYCAIEHDWDYSPAVTPACAYAIDQSRAYGMLERNPEKDIGPLKVRQVVYLQRWWSGALESLMFDLYGVAPMRFMPPTRVEQMIRGVTGWDFSLLELMLIGDRRITLLQEFNRRQGLTRQDDTLPERIFSEPIVEGPYKGWVLDREEFDRAISWYYAMNNWDEAGWPSPAKLYDLELQWVLDSRT
jgi:aldehyde:ferredoxin oxidoreductase